MNVMHKKGHDVLSLLPHYSKAEFLPKNPTIICSLIFFVSIVENMGHFSSVSRMNRPKSENWPKPKFNFSGRSRSLSRSLIKYINQIFQSFITKKYIISYNQSQLTSWLLTIVTFLDGYLQTTVQKCHIFNWQKITQIVKLIN